MRTTFKEYKENQAYNKMTTNPTYARVNEELKKLHYALTYAYVDSKSGDIKLQALGDGKNAILYPDIVLDRGKISIDCHDLDKSYDYNTFKYVANAYIECYKAVRYINSLIDDKTLRMLAIMEK